MNARTLATPIEYGKYSNIGASLGESPTNTKRSRAASRSIPNSSASSSARHRELVVLAEPAVDVDRRYLGGQSLGSHQRDDALDTGSARSGAHVLAVVDREVAFAILLVGRERATRHFAQNALRDRGETLAIASRRSVVDERSACAACVRAASWRMYSAPFSPTTASTGHMRAM